MQLVTPSPFTLRFDTTSGDLQASGIPIEKLGRRTYAAHVGNQGADIIVHTVSGDVAVRKGDVDAPEVPVAKAKEDEAETPGAPGSDRKAEALEILNALEQGEIDADEAARRLDSAR